MSSVKQIAANLANAGRSMGPRTSAGKARSRMNAWKHGLTAEKVPGEDAEQLKAIRRELWEEYEPLPGMESLLVDRIVHYEWRMRRPARGGVARRRTELPGEVGYSDGNALAILLRYEMAFANALVARYSSYYFCKTGARSRMAAQSSNRKAPSET